MKKIILLLLPFVFLSCSSNQRIFDPNENKSVLIVINNESNIPLLEEYKNEILNSVTKSKKNKNIKFHTITNESVKYDYLIQVLIKEIEIVETSENPKSQKYQTVVSNPYTITDLNSNTSKTIYTSMAYEGEINEFINKKYCTIDAEINLLNLENGELVTNKKIKSTSLIKNNKIEKKGDQYYANNNASVYSNNNLNNSMKFENNISYNGENNTNPKFNTTIISQSEDHDLLYTAVLKIKKHYISFLNDLK
ncbi:hypothetical protein NAT47_08360 [Flavobacterium sp. HXWNR69]|uniref:Lipoprotein n=1 Tax=Flavobacterium fragile TaxID=2949085 RepID=A0ABT0THK0_9FLAO|nr:hypothetical protein [Flavobacterium sp. HXWNR69]MCL9770428.1 hypothetical protein [Flavobacterium sp. HXWNR69]